MVDELRAMHEACQELEHDGEPLRISSWVEQHSLELQHRSGNLQLELMHLCFLRHLLRGDTPGALQALRRFTATPRPAHHIEARIRKLVGAIAYASHGASDGSPYVETLNETAQRRTVKALFTQECLLRLRLPAISALETHVEAGTLVLPKLAKLASVLKDKYVRICQEGGTLPIEIDLGPRFVSHSVFTCPISKEAGTADNPPMLLQCGHVLSLVSVTKLARGSRSAHFKCPYCPQESTMAQAKVVEL